MNLFISWAIYLLPLLPLSYLALSSRFKASFSQTYIIYPLLLYLLIVFGLAYRLGPDYNVLSSIYEQYEFESYFRSAPLFGVINLFCRSLNFPVEIVFFVCIFIFLLGLIRFTALLPRPWMALTLAYPYYIVVFTINFPRQSAALGLVLLAIRFLFIDKRKMSFIFVILGSLFHSSSLFVLPLLFASYRSLYSKKYLLWIFLIIPLLAVVWFTVPYFSSSIQSNLINFYSSGSIYTSRGVFLRLIPLLFGAFLFLCFKSRLGLNRVQSNILTAISLLCSVLLLLVFISPASSTVADRLSAYLLPLLLLPVPLLSKFIF